MKEIDLRITTKQVFDECAPVYLKEDKHWGCDLDIISEYVEKFGESEVIELGTGHAWHLANLFFTTSNKLKRVVGIDYSEKMLERASTFLSSIFQNGCPLIEKVELRKADILSLPFDNEKFDVALLLNNTLGNIPAETFDKARDQRKKALSKIRKILRQSGYLILSVYNSGKIVEEDEYGKVFELDRGLSNFDTLDLVVRYKKTGALCYSHWFSTNEIRQLLLDVSFRVVMVEERGKRIVVVAQKERDVKLYETASNNGT